MKYLFAIFGSSSLKRYSAISLHFLSKALSIFSISALKVQIIWHSTTSDKIQSAIFRIDATTSV